MPVARADWSEREHMQIGKKLCCISPPVFCWRICTKPKPTCYASNDDKSSQKLLKTV